MKKYNLLIPMAGKAQRFADKGYKMPKPLIMAKTKHVIDWAMDSVWAKDCNIIFEVRLDHINNFSIDKILRSKFGDDIKIVVIDHDTEGSVCTCMLAEEHIDNDLPLIIYTPDVCFEPAFDPGSIDESLDGFILSFKANSPAHSYIELDDNGFAVKTAEKQVISSNAAVGVYYYKTGRMFMKYAKEMVDKKIKTKNEFYICPMFNMIIRDGGKVKIDHVDKMHVLGTPQELEFFVKNVSYKFGERPIALCSDHSGFDAKEATKVTLKKMGIEYIDFGCYVEKDSDYTDFASQVVQAIKDNTCDFGMGFCRTGQGVNMFMNHKGLRSALVSDEFTAEMAVRHNCANFFSIPQKYVTPTQIKEIIEVIKRSSFDGGRHMSRMKETIGYDN